MGEKDIVEDDSGTGRPVEPSPGTSSTGTPPTSGSGTGGGIASSGGGGGAPQGSGTPAGGSGGGSPGDDANDCAQIQFDMAELLKALEVARKNNLEASTKAVDAFLQYKGALQPAKVTEALVESNNAVGKKLIEAALYAAKKLGGGEHVDQGWVEKAEKAKDAVLDGLADWMKDGATSGALKEAAKKYADFVGKAAAANAAADEMRDLKKQLDKLAADATAKKCPAGTAPTIPNSFVHSFDIGTFGQGAIDNEKGPMMRKQQLDGSASPQPTDMFAHPDRLK